MLLDARKPAKCLLGKINATQLNCNIVCFPALDFQIYRIMNWLACEFVCISFVKLQISCVNWLFCFL
jgi:hypothetical protein